MKSRKTYKMQFAVPVRPGAEEVHRIYWDGAGSLFLASHTDQTFAQHWTMWKLMGEQGACQCARFVCGLRASITGSVYSRSVARLVHNAAAGNSFNYQMFEHTMLVTNSLGDRRKRSKDNTDLLDTNNGRRAGRVEQIKRRRFQKLMFPIFYEVSQCFDGYETGSFDITLADVTTVDGPVYSALSVHGTKRHVPARLSMVVDVHAWDKMRRGFGGKIADPDKQPIMGFGLVMMPKTGLPALCVKVLMVTPEQGVKRFRIGYRYLTYDFTDTGDVTECWHPVHETHGTSDWKSDRF